MKANRTTFLLLSIASAVLLSLGFLFPHCGGFALVALVPLLWMDRLASRNACRHFWIWHYLCFVLWNAFTTFWVCNATVGGGIFAILANALQMSVIWALFRLFKKYFGSSLPYIFLACMWIAWERAYFDAEISWPWLVLGNSFARTTSMIQWYDTTGLLGGSLWIWACNLAVFGICCALEEGRWKAFNIKAKAAAIIACTALFIVPPVISLVKYSKFSPDSSAGKLEACVLQPNIDPYNKFQALTQSQQNDILTAQMKQVMQETADDGSALLFIAPETFTSDVYYNDFDESATIQQLRGTIAERQNTDVLFGASAYEFFYQNNAPSVYARRLRDGRWYQNYNVAMMLDGSDKVQSYKKSKLVVGVEKTPYPAFFTKIDDMLGGVMGRCMGQSDVSLLNTRSKVGIGCAVCYESIYPEHVAKYVRKGAKALCVITNDAWWGDTPGYRQHLCYSCLRAIETRRDIARSANTGISAFINQRGDIVSSTQWWEKAQLGGTLSLSTTLTPFVKYGDICGRICSFVFLMLLLALAGNIITKRKR